MTGVSRLALLLGGVTFGGVLLAVLLGLLIAVLGLDAAVVAGTTVGIALVVAVTATVLQAARFAWLLLHFAALRSEEGRAQLLNTSVLLLAQIIVTLPVSLFLLGVIRAA